MSPTHHRRLGQGAAVALAGVAAGSLLGRWRLQACGSSSLASLKRTLRARPFLCRLGASLDVGIGARKGAWALSVENRPDLHLTQRGHGTARRVPRRPRPSALERSRPTICSSASMRGAGDGRPGRRRHARPDPGSLEALALTEREATSTGGMWRVRNFVQGDLVFAKARRLHDELAGVLMGGRTRRREPWRRSCRRARRASGR